MSEPPPFVIFALPRSRTYWCSRFLTYGGWICGHEEIKHLRGLDDVRSWLTMPMTGTVETLGAPFWRYLMQARPDCRVATIRRRWQDSLSSLLGLGVPFRRETLALQLRQLDAKLDQIEARIPGVLRLGFDDLATEEGCQALFEHCLGMPFNRDWWQAYAPLNLQIDVLALFRYMRAHRPQLEKLGKTVRHRILSGMRPHEMIEDGIAFRVERFSPEAVREAVPLTSEHLVQTGQAPDDYQRKNLPLLQTLQDIGALQYLTARANGRLFGYLMTVIAPSLDSPDELQGEHTIFFASPEIRNLGMRLQRAALEALRERGVNSVIMRAGHRGSGPRLGTFYRRLGAEEFGQLYRLELEDAA